MLGALGAKRGAARASVALGFAAAIVALWGAGPADASFGIVPGGFQVSATNRDGTIDRAAGSHPYAFTVRATFNHDAQENAEGSARAVVVDLPPGLVGNPLATPRCKREAFDGRIKAKCPGGTQVGTFHAYFRNPQESLAPGGAVYNLVPPKGVAASFGFSGAGFVVIEDASVARVNGVYTVVVTASNISHEDLVEFEETIWGVPADESHDPERECPGSGQETIHGCASESPPAPFLTLPGSCGKPMVTTLEADSTEAPGVFEKATAVSEEAGTPAGLLGCEQLEFNPNISVRPETEAAATNTGLDVDVEVPQPESTDGLAEADARETVLTLPPGMVVNPSSGNGLAGCSSAQIALESNEPQACPEASKIGTVTVDTPLLDHPLPGAVYLASQGDNPFGSLLAIYIVVEDPETGTIVKLAGHVEPDPVTGQLRTVVDDLPQFPFTDVKVDLNGGPRASLLTPDTCGTKTATAELEPWSEGASADPVSSFAITSGPGGSRCSASPAEEPDAPSFSAGTTFPDAGAFSPFELRLSREQGTQQIAALQTTLPPGLVGRLAGIERCSDARIAAAQRAGRTGREEIASPSCPAGSEVGTVDVAAGGGALPLHVTGHVYLAGPYEGAPFSLAVITPAVAGPFDLGVVVVRAALRIDPYTAQVTVASDPIPTILQGIPLDVRTITVDVARQGFTLNPTSCGQASLLGTVGSALGGAANVSSPFQTQGCTQLAFAPAFTAATSAHASKADGTGLHVKVVPPVEGPWSRAQEANIKTFKVELPKQLPARLTTLQKACLAAQFDANPAGCPAASMVGVATVHTPLLANPLTGPAYFVSHGNEAFPQLIMVLQGEGITVDVAADTFISKAGITSSTIKAAPDVPFSSFELTLPPGPYSALTANGNLCAQRLSMPTYMTAQNGATHNQDTPLEVEGCPATIAVTGHRVRGRALTVSVYVPAAGKVEVRGNGLKAKSRSADGRETLTLTLAQAHRGRLSTRVHVLFVPRHGRRQAKTLRVRFPG